MWKPRCRDEESLPSTATPTREPYGPPNRAGESLHPAATTAPTTIRIANRDVTCPAFLGRHLAKPGPTAPAQLETGSPPVSNLYKPRINLLLMHFSDNSRNLIDICGVVPVSLDNHSFRRAGRQLSPFLPPRRSGRRFGRSLGLISGPKPSNESPRAGPPSARGDSRFVGLSGSRGSIRRCRRLPLAGSSAPADT
jgi:hypothetical protein